MFQVKLVVRPNLPKSVLDDINKMKKKMHVQATFVEICVKRKASVHGICSGKRADSKN